MKQTHTRTFLNKTGFTLIELTMVMAIIGILVLLAVPRLEGQTEKATVINTRNTILITESKVSETIILNRQRVTQWQEAPKGELEHARNRGALYNKDGVVPDAAPLTNAPYKQLPHTFVTEKMVDPLAGTFFIDQDGAVYYTPTELPDYSEPPL